LIKDIFSKCREKSSPKKLLSKISLDQWILLLVSVGSFLRWVKFPLSGGISPFNLHSPILLSWGLLFLPIVILAIMGISRWFLFILLIMVFSFPLQIHWDYGFIQDIALETLQMNDIRQFTKKNVFEPNVLDDTPTDINHPDVSDLWTAPWSRVTLTVDSLGIGFWIVFIGTVIVSRKLGARRITIALLVSITLSIPGIMTASFLTLGRSAFLVGNYSKSVDMYKLAMRIDQSLGNRTLNRLELYYLWFGESLFHMGVRDEPQVYFFLAKNLQQVRSFSKSREMYWESMSLPPTRRALAKAMVDEAIMDIKEKSFGSAMDRLNEAYGLDRNNFESLFYMAYISFVLKDRKSASYYSGLLFDSCKEKLLFADLYNILGDTYNKTGELVDSRNMYIKSVDTFDRVKNGNYHAWVGIAGW